MAAKSWEGLLGRIWFNQISHILIHLVLVTLKDQPPICEVGSGLQHFIGSLDNFEFIS